MKNRQSLSDEDLAWVKPAARQLRDKAFGRTRAIAVEAGVPVHSLQRWARGDNLPNRFSLAGFRRVCECVGIEVPN